MGTGWAAVSFRRNLKPNSKTWVTVVSPRGEFVYTPLLPAATTGSAEARSIVESIHTFLPLNGIFYEAAATSFHPQENQITCTTALDPNRPFILSYDTLVVAVGAVANTFNTPGVVEYAHFLKSIEDAMDLRQTINARWEKAALQTTTLEERQRLLSFVICGGGPTGVELAAELQDAFQRDLKQHRPSLASLAKVTIVDATCHLLSMFDRQIADFATQSLSQHDIRNNPQHLCDDSTSPWRRR